MERVGVGGEKEAQQEDKREFKLKQRTTNLIVLTRLFAKLQELHWSINKKGRGRPTR